uniref:Putative conserved secreted protein n=1 Tax=Culex tarsalis TaxID=7177 RepID=A0A1Q3FPN9_CULTA
MAPRRWLPLVTATTVVLPMLVLAQGGMSVDQDATCSQLDRRQYLDQETAEPMVEEDFRGQVTVLYSVAPPKTFLTRRIYRERDPIYYNKIAFEEQIQLFHNLLNRFEGNGYSDVQFILGASAARFPDECDEFGDFEDFLDNVTSIAAGYNISVYPNPLNENGTYSMYGLKEFQVYVLDRCSRIAYIIEPPWSLIQYSYVKAAVLSTLYDRPCGECEVDNFLNSSLPVQKMAAELQMSSTTSTTTTTSTEPSRSSSTSSDVRPYDDSTESEEQPVSTEEYSEPPEPTTTTEEMEILFRSNITDANVTDDDEDPFSNLTVTGPELSIPLKIVIPSIHIHYDQPREDGASYDKYSYVVFQSDNPSLHQHDPSDERDPPASLREISLANATANSTLRVEGVLWPLPQLAEMLNASSQMILYDDRTTQVFRKIARYNASGFDELEELSIASQYAAWKRRQADRAELAKTEKRQYIRKHYERLIQWLSWQFDKS